MKSGDYIQHETGFIYKILLFTRNSRILIQINNPSIYSDETWFLKCVDMNSFNSEHNKISKYKVIDYASK
jgi:hypothetical protein